MLSLQLKINYMKLFTIFNTFFFFLILFTVKVDFIQLHYLKIVLDINSFLRGERSYLECIRK